MTLTQKTHRCLLTLSLGSSSSKLSGLPFPHDRAGCDPEGVFHVLAQARKSHKQHFRWQDAGLLLGLLEKR